MIALGFSIAAILILARAAQHDWKTRTCPNEFWVLLLIPGAYHVGLTGSMAAWVVGLAVGGTMWLAGSGGADAKAVMAAGLLFTDPFLYAGLVLCSHAGALPLLLLRDGRGAPFLVPLAVSLSTGLLMGFLWPS